MMEQPIVEVIDDTKGFLWRMRLAKEVSEWYGYYQGILTYTFKDGRTFGVTSGYFSPQFPELFPFQIIVTEPITQPIVIQRDEETT